MTPMTDDAQLAKFFNSQEGRFMGAVGDYHLWTPTETAICFLTLYAQHIRRRAKTKQAVEESERDLDALLAYVMEAHTDVV